MNDLSFYKSAPSQQDAIAAQEKLEAIVRYLARSAAEHDFQREQQDQQAKEFHTCH